MEGDKTSNRAMELAGLEKTEKKLPKKITNPFLCFINDVRNLFRDPKI
jgi:hypothetical protein